MLLCALPEAQMDIIWKFIFHSHGPFNTLCRDVQKDGCEKRKICQRGRRGVPKAERVELWKRWRRGCMIKAYILKSLTSPLVWLMGPTLQADRSKGLEKWCNYCFLNSGLKRPVWKEDLEEILQGILDSRLSPLHPSTPPATHPDASRPNYTPSHPRRLSWGITACFTSPL